MRVASGRRVNDCKRATWRIRGIFVFGDAFFSAKSGELFGEISQAH